MTDAVERVAEVIHEAMRFERMNLPKWQNGNSLAEDRARIASQAAIDALIDGVELEWVELGDKWGTVTSGGIQITQKFCPPNWDLSCSSPEADGYFYTLEEAKAAALSDYRNRLRKALGIDAPPSDD